jgi:hypothetical protein
MNVVRKSWLGTILLAAAISAAVAYRARRPDYEALSIHELVLCKLWTSDVMHDPGPFLIVDCQTGTSATGIYVVGGQAFATSHVRWEDYGRELSGDLAAPRLPTISDPKIGQTWPDDQEAR